MKSDPKQSLQLLISHQMRLYSSAKGLCGLNYSCFSGTQVLGQFRETGPKYPKSCTKTYEEKSKDFSSSLTFNEVLLLFQSHLRVQLYLSYGYLSIRTIWGNRAQIPPNHMKWHMKSNAVIGIRYPMSFRVLNYTFHIKWSLTQM